MDTRDDDALIAELRTALDTLDPVPEHVVEAAKATFAWRRVDEALAELVDDSATQPLSPARSAGRVTGHPGADASDAAEPVEPRLLTFRGPGLTVEVEVTHLDSDSRRIVGQLVPPRSAEVEVRWQGGSVTSEADTIGLFSATAIPAGPVSIVCRPGAGEAQVVTSWITI